MPPTGHQKNEEKEPCDHNNGGEDGAGHPQEARRKLSEATAEELRNLVAAAIDRMKGAWDETKAENFANSVLERLGTDEDAALPTPFGLALLCTGKMLAEHGTAGDGGSAFGDGVGLFTVGLLHFFLSRGLKLFDQTLSQPSAWKAMRLHLGSHSLTAWIKMPSVEQWILSFASPPKKSGQVFKQRQTDAHRGTLVII